MSRSSATRSVVSVLRRELGMLRGRPPADAKALLGLGDQLLARAALDDDLPRRRAESAANPPADPATLIALELAEDPTGNGELTAADDGPSFHSAAPPSMTQADVVDAFERGAPGMRVRAVADLRRISGGFSKETIRALVVDDDDVATDVVIRKVAPGRRADGLRPEYDVVSFVATSPDVPAPRPLWFLDDCAGTPAFAASGLPGAVLGDVWGWKQYPPEQAAQDLGTVMGRLHSLDVSTLTAAPLPPLTSHQDHLDAITERTEVLTGIWRQGEDAFRPVFELVLAWLRDNAPDDTDTQVLVHGDFGLHNILFSDGRMQGLLDWERAHRGNPAEDLAYLKPSLDQVEAWPQFLAAYADAGGPPVVHHDLAYFTVWQDLWRAVSAYRIRAKFLADPIQLSDSVSGLIMTPRFLARAAHGVGQRQEA